jgi:hypothetical protein
MQSKYFSPAFNSAIFDGPVRIYFAQFHESLALKIYFLLQQKWPQEFARCKDLSKAAHANILIMVYPTEESFLQSVDGEPAKEQNWITESWNEDAVIAMRGPIEDEKMDEFMNFAGQTLRNWNPRSLESLRSEIAL